MADLHDQELWIAGEAGGAAPPVIGGDIRRITGGSPPDNLSASRDGSGRFVPGTRAGGATRFKKGRSGNPAGRPKGSFRAGTRAAAALLDAQGQALAEKALELALGGDAVSVRFCLGRLLGVKRGQPVEFDLQPVAAPGDLAAAVAAVTAAVADGRITPDEALSLSQMLDGLPRVFAAIPPPPEDRWAGGEDPREALIRELDRLAARKEAARAQTRAALCAGEEGAWVDALLLPEPAA